MSFSEWCRYLRELVRALWQGHSWRYAHNFASFTVDFYRTLKAGRLRQVVFGEDA